MFHLVLCRRFEVSLNVETQIFVRLLCHVFTSVLYSSQIKMSGISRISRGKLKTSLKVFIHMLLSDGLKIAYKTVQNKRDSKDHKLAAIQCGRCAMCKG